MPTPPAPADTTGIRPPLAAAGPAPGPARSRMRPLPLLAALGTGAALTLESVVNGRLGTGIRPVPAAAFSDVLSLLVMVCVAPLLPGLRPAFRRIRPALRDRRLRPWHLMGGVAGGCMVLTQAAVAADLGPALYALALVSGQTLAGLLVDHYGLGPGGALSVSVRRGLGAALTVVAVVAPVVLEPGDRGTVWLAAVPFLAGVGLSLQMAANGRTDEVAGNAYPSVILSFLTGAVILLLALAADLAAHGAPADWPGNPLDYTGGTLGVIVVLGSVLVVRRIGVLAAGLGMIAGQVASSVLLGAVLHTGAPQGWVTAASAGLLLTAVALASTGERRGTTPASPSLSPSSSSGSPSASSSDPTEKWSL
ncbi:DMT family transporter [Streptomyces sp. NPDC003943]